MSEVSYIVRPLKDPAMPGAGIWIDPAGKLVVSGWHVQSQPVGFFDPDKVILAVIDYLRDRAMASPEEKLPPVDHSILQE